MVELEQKYNYTDKKIEHLEPSQFKFQILTEMDGNCVYRSPDEIPTFIGGTSRYAYFMLTLNYPLDAKRAGIQGKVIISPIITKDGLMIDGKRY